MRRREFIGLLGGASLAWPLAGRAQSSGKVHRIGVLRVGEPPPSYIQPFRQALSRLGYVDGQNIIIEYGLAQSVEQLPDVAAELILALDLRRLQLSHTHAELKEAFDLGRRVDKRPMQLRIGLPGADVADEVR